MFKIIKSVIENTEFKLEDILYKINKMYMEDILNEEEKNELDNLSNTVVITGGNGSGKSRFLKFLLKNFKLYIDGSNSDEVSFNVINDKDGPEEVLTSELAKSFSDDSSPSFINGVLAGVINGLEN